MLKLISGPINNQKMEVQLLVKSASEAHTFTVAGNTITIGPETYTIVSIVMCPRSVNYSVVSSRNTTFDIGVYKNKVTVTNVFRRTVTYVIQ